MKKMIVFAIAFFNCNLLFAQLNVASVNKEKVIGEVRKLGYPTATFTQQLADEDTTYTIRYRDFQDMDANNYYNITFKATTTEINQLHQILLSVYAPENAKNKSYTVNFSLGNTPVTVKNYTYSVFTMCDVRTNQGYFQLTRGQIDKLFGKN